ncbi:MAG: TIGR00180 family glycosyltransferase [Betaproteobacteria bacterium]|nr:TIGR00180 family glycosyltransferase [Betaproteobacteria bacterium]
MSNGHTLVIPTYNRPAELRRLVRYYYTRAWPMNLLVLDSSRPGVAEENAKMLSSLGESVRHVIFPGTTPMAAKLAQGLALVQSPYVSFCADDDLVLPNGLREAVAFLKDHPDYVSAHGLYINFRREGHDVHLMREYAGPSNEAAHAGARIYRLLQKYESLFYGVFRTPDLREIVSAVAALPTLHYQELFQSAAALIKGKVFRFPRLFGARQSCDPAEPERDKWQTYYWFAEDPAEVFEHYHAYRAALWSFYQAHAFAPLLEKEKFFKILDLAHAVYFSASCPPEYFHSVLQPYWPDDAYVKVGDIDLFDRLGRPAAGSLPETDAKRRRRDAQVSANSQRWSAARICEALPVALKAVLAAPALARLNYQARHAFRTPWRCRLSVRLRWLAGVDDFRAAYFELCRYLDQA